MLLFVIPWCSVGTIEFLALDLTPDRYYVWHITRITFHGCAPKRVINVPSGMLWIRSPDGILLRFCLTFVAYLFMPRKRVCWSAEISQHKVCCRSLFGVEMPTQLVKFVRKLRGGSQPILARAADEQLYVVKFGNNPQGANLLFNESVGTDLYRAYGLPVPEWKSLVMTDSFLDENPDCWMQTQAGTLRPNAGLCFGSRYLGGDGISLFDILPGNSYKRVSNLRSFWLAWIVDVCAQHTDCRQAIFLEGNERRLNAFFVDQGSLFGGADGKQQPHFLASRYLDPRIYQELSSADGQELLQIVRSVDLGGIWRGVQTLPTSWVTGSALECLERCLGRLANAELLQDLVDRMVDADQKQHIAFRKGRSLIERRLSILCPGLQTVRSLGGFGRCVAGYAPCP